MDIDRPSYLSTELTAFKQAPNYYASILSYFAPYLGSRVVEIGAGIGTFSKYFLSCPHITSLTLIEPADNLFPILSEEFSGNARVRLVNGHLAAVAGSLSCDSAVLINVLEHIDHDEDLLRTIHHSLAPGGTLLLFVPALPGLYGSLDAAFRHVRRYRKAELHALLSKVGFEVVSLRYFNLPGIVTWFLAGKVFKRTSLDPWSVWLYDRLCMSWIPGVERRWEPVFGQSLLAVARVSRCSQGGFTARERCR